MAKFHVLKYNQWVMSKLGVYSHRLTDPTNEFFKSIRSYYILFTIFSFNVTCSVVYIYVHWPNYEMFFEPIAMACAGVQTFGMFLSIGLQMKNVKSLHLKLQEIVDEKDLEDKIHANYWKAEQKCRKYTKTIFSYFFCHESLLLAAFLYPIYCMYNGQYNTSKWILPFVLSVPFDTSTYFGWYLLWFIQLNISIAYISVILSTTSYFVSCSVYICAICEHFDLLFKSLKEDVDRSQEGKQKVLKGNSQGFRNKINKIKRAVDIHVKAYEVFRIVANINSGTIFSFLPISGLLLALIMYNTENTPFDLTMLEWHLICLVCGSFWPFLICVLATIATERIYDIGNTVYDSNWLDLPVDLQKCVIFIIARSQGDINFNGLNLFYCNLEVFGKILRTSCSYYLMFRKLTE